MKSLAQGRVNTRRLSQVVLAGFLYLISPSTFAQEIRSYFVTDVVGSPVLATDEGGNVTWDEDYLPYGERRYESANADSSDRWFTNAPQNSDSGLVDLGNRMYDPLVGRFYGIDPVGASPSRPFKFNRFAYANNNPYSFIDPDGREIKVASTVVTTSGGTTNATVFLKFTGALRNTGATLPAASTLSSLASALETQIESDFSQSFTDASGNVTRYVMDADIIVGTATASSKRHNIELLPHGAAQLGGGIGRAPNLDLGNDMFVSDATLNSGLLSVNPNMSFNRTGSHEFGHSAGLRHPGDPANLIVGLPTANLMSQTRNSAATSVTRSQLRAIFKNARFR